MVFGLRIEQALELGRWYRQVAIFEITVEEVRVLRASNGAVVASRDRRHRDRPE